jgi:hypothetical protein
MRSSFHIWQKQYGTTVQYTQIEINDYSVKINISSKKNSVKSVTKKEVLISRFGTEDYHDDVVVIFFLIFLNISKNSTISLTFLAQCILY